jgi:hypothetical protein
MSKLTDKTIRKLADKQPTVADYDWSWHEVLAFARDIEREVLAAATAAQPPMRNIESTLDELMGALDLMPICGKQQYREKLRKALAAATAAQPVKDIKDAARYRWLRDGWGRTSNRMPHITQYPAQQFDKPRMPQIRDVGLDAAIDAAMQAQDATGGGNG